MKKMAINTLQSGTQSATITSIVDFKAASEAKKRLEVPFSVRRAETMLQLADFVANLAEAQPDLGLKFAADAATPPSVLAALARSTNEAIRALVAQNPSTDDLTVYFLKNDQSTGVRQAMLSR
jgi:hypothetical protein